MTPETPPRDAAPARADVGGARGQMAWGGGALRGVSELPPMGIDGSVWEPVASPHSSKPLSSLWG